VQIERREYKYLIDEGTALELREAVRPFCTLDRYGSGRPIGRYWIASLYLDTPDLRLYRANQHEVVDRFKVRVRGYPGSGSDAVFLEVKRRVNDVISKTRGALAGEEWRSLLGEPGRGLLGVPSSRRAALERFVCLVQRHDLRPTMLVRYEREAWVSLIDAYARVTFDRRVQSQPRDELSLDAAPGHWRSSDDALSQRSSASQTILELKFTTAAPRWMMHLVQRFDLFRSSFSKYGTSIEAWRALPPEWMARRRRGVAA
jgi:hypothetical protein